MSLYSGLSIRDIYTRSCNDLGCKVNSYLGKSLPQTPDLFTVPVTIDLSNNLLGPKGLKPLFEVIRISSELRVLNLSDQQLTNASVTDLCAVVKDHPSLVQINLSKNPLTIAAGMALVEMLKENRTLESILLEGTDVKPTVLSLINTQLQNNIVGKKRGSVGAAAAGTLSGSSADGSVGATSPAAAAADLLSTITVDESLETEAPAVRAALSAIKSTVNHKLLDEDPFPAIRALCKDFGKFYADPHFLPDRTSIQKTEAKEYFVTRKKWKRVITLYNEMRRNSVANTDAAEGQVEGSSSPIGDIFGPRLGEVVFPNAANVQQKGFSWQFSALQSVIGRADVTQNSIRSLIQPAVVNPLGFYVVKVFVDSEWRYIVVDDQLPVDVDGNLVFTQPSTGALSSSSSSSSSFFWPCIYEKAMAKAHGSYQALDTMVPQGVKHHFEKPPSPSSLMKDATGGVGISRDIQHQQFDSREWWQTLLALPEETTAIVAVSSDADESRCAPSGIESAHCYKVLQVRQVNGFSLLQLQSNFSSRKYSDNWHDGCKNWSDYPLVADALGIAKKADTSFWIPYHRFLHLFKSMHICRLFPHANVRALTSQWTALTAGGPSFGHHWGYNPHFRFSVTDRSSVFINLALCDGRFKEAKEEVETLAFHLLKSPCYPLEFHADEVVGKTEYVITNAVSYEGILSVGDYWLVPSSYISAKQSQFWFRVFSTAPMVLSFEPEGRYWTPRAVTCPLDSAGEYQNGEDNAQVELKIPATTNGVATFRIVCVVQATEASNDTNAIIFLVRPNELSATETLQQSLNPPTDAPRRFVGTIPDANIVTKSSFIVGDRVCLEATITVPEKLHYKEQRYFIVPCISPARTCAKLKMTVFLSEPKFSIEPLPLWPRRQITCQWNGAKGGSAPLQCLNAANPQIELCPRDADSHFVIHMSVTGTSEPPSIFFALVVNDNGAGYPLPFANDTGDDNVSVKLPEGKVIAKSAFIRHHSVTMEVKLPKEVRQESYVIVPYLQPTGSEGTCTITVSNKSGGFAVHNLVQ